MKFNLPKDDSRFRWTRHIKNKMIYYHISKAQIMRIFKSPDRIEEGIAEDTIGAMKIKKSKGKEEELWLMYQVKEGKYTSANNPLAALRTKKRVTMISVWRYPGRTKEGEQPEIPEDVLIELKKAL